MNRIIGLPHVKHSFLNLLVSFQPLDKISDSDTYLCDLAIGLGDILLFDKLGKREWLCYICRQYSFVVDNKFMGRFCSSVSPCNENTCVEQRLHFGCKGPNLAVLIWEVGVSGVTAYKLTISLRKLKLAEDCFHTYQGLGCLRARRVHATPG